MMLNAKNKKAFSLIELSIVLLIISIIVAGTISVSTVAVNNSKTKVTRERIDAIQKAINAFVAKNYRLPCPASIKSVKSSTSTFGIEATSCSTNGDGVYKSSVNSNAVYGMVPVNALGIPDDLAEDGYGSKFSYIVDTNYTSANYPSTTTSSTGFSFYPTTNNISIVQFPSANKISNIAYVIISHGPNKYGAYNTNFSSQNSTSSANEYEVTNALSSIVDNSGNLVDGATFGLSSASGLTGIVSITATHSENDIFDDIILAKTRDDIISENNLGFLKVCTSLTPNQSSGFGNAYSGSIAYRATNCAAPNDSIKPSKECGSYASTWIDKITCP